MVGATRPAVRARRPASSTASTSTGSGRARRQRRQRDPARGQAELHAADGRSSAASSTRTARRWAGTTRSRRSCRPTRPRSPPASRCRRSSAAWTGPPCRATTSTARGSRRPTTSATCSPGGEPGPGQGVQRSTWRSARTPSPVRRPRSWCSALPAYGRGWTGVGHATTGCTRPAPRPRAPGRPASRTTRSSRTGRARVPGHRHRRALAVRRHELVVVRRPDVIAQKTAYVKSQGARRGHGLGARR